MTTFLALGYDSSPIYLPIFILTELSVIVFNLLATEWSQFISVQLLCHVQLFATPWTAARQASLSITNSQNLLKLMSVESLMPSNHLILCHPLLLPPSIFPSIRVFSNQLVLCIRWPKYWSISASSEYSGLISSGIDWLDLLAVQGTLKSVLLHHSSKASILLHWAFFIVQLSHPYMTTGKTIPQSLLNKKGNFLHLFFVCVYLFFYLAVLGLSWSMRHL